MCVCVRDGIEGGGREGERINKYILVVLIVVVTQTSFYFCPYIFLYISY